MRSRADTTFDLLSRVGRQPGDNGGTSCRVQRRDRVLDLLVVTSTVSLFSRNTLAATASNPAAASRTTRRMVLGTFTSVPFLGVRSPVDAAAVRSSAYRRASMASRTETRAF